VSNSAKESAQYLASDSFTGQAPLTQELKWAAARVILHLYIGFSLVTVVGGILTAPVMTYYFFKDWRFWRHLGPGLRMFPHGYKMLYKILTGEGAYMLSVSLTSAPNSSPDLGSVRLSATWEHGYSCGTCSRCCEKIGCPVLDKATGLCQGYDSFFWRYFNCGRFPTAQPEIDYYDCPKWEIKPRRQSSGRVA
jgi:hypothetical protein